MARTPSSPVAAPNRITLLVILSGAFLVTLGFFSINVAIPDMKRELHASDATIQWVIAAFAVTLAGGLISGGRLGDIAGRRSMFAIGLAIFTLASAACGLAAGPPMLIAGRIVQGIGAALLLPQVLALIGALYDGERRKRAFTMYGLTLGLAAVGGQLIGGLLVQADLANLGWRWCFLINVPIGIVAIVLVPLFVPAGQETRRGQLDFRGAVLGSAAIIAVVLAVIQGRATGWPVWVWACLVGGVVAGLAFVRYQDRLRTAGGVPLVDLTLFANRPFAVGILAVVTFFLGNASFYLTLALYLQGGVGLSALGSGEVFGLMGVGYFATALRPGWLVRRLGSGWLPVGAITMVVGYGVLLAAVLRDRSMDDAT